MRINENRNQAKATSVMIFRLNGEKEGGLQNNLRLNYVNLGGLQLSVISTSRRVRFNGAADVVEVLS